MQVFPLRVGLDKGQDKISFSESLSWQDSGKQSILEEWVTPERMRAGKRSEALLKLLFDNQTCNTAWFVPSKPSVHKLSNLQNIMICPANPY